jgi:hypothetical protein
MDILIRRHADADDCSALWQTNLHLNNQALISADVLVVAQPQHGVAPGMASTQHIA